jgi:glycine/D-amino acid oxidase-like deaminating enzyme
LDLREERRAVVVGAGITGAFAAYFLARRGERPLLVERAGVAAGASGNNPGGLNPLHGPGIPGPLSDLAWHSFLLHLRPTDELARAGVAVRRVRRLEVALDASEADTLGADLARSRQADGFEARWLDAGELRRLEPRVSPRAVGALWTDGNGMVDCRTYTGAIVRAASALGAELRIGCVEGIEQRNGRAVAVRIDGVGIACGALVVATGAHVEGPANWLGTTIPVEPVKGQLLSAEHGGAPLPHHVTRGLSGVYQSGANRVWVGGTHERAGWDAAPSREGRETLLGEAERLLPGLGPLAIREHVCAFRPVTPDGLPILGRVPGWENVTIATGAGPKGMLLGAGMGECAAALSVGSDPPVDLSPFRPGRFMDGQVS